MKVSSWLRFPVPYKFDAAIKEGDRAIPPQMQTVMFELRRGPDKDDIFYECLACKMGAGCPCFSVLFQEVPAEIYEHLAMHVEMCAGVVHTMIQK